MKKKTSVPVKSGKRSAKKPSDRVAAEFSEVKNRRIPPKDVVWIFHFTAASTQQCEAALAECIEYLASVLGKRCRVTLERFVDGGRQLQDLIVKPPQLTLETLRTLDRGLASVCRTMNVKYRSVSYGEEVYKTTSWKTLGTVLKVSATSVEPPTELDCRTLRFDGLYCHSLDGDSGHYLRFYPDGVCVAGLVSGGTITEVAKWFRREMRFATIGNYQLKHSTFSAVLEQNAVPSEPPTIFRLKGRLTKQGLKVQSWSSYSNTESQEVYAFHPIKLR